MIVFVYEDVCASAAGGDDKSPPAASLLREGRAMLDAVTADFRGVRGVHVEQAASTAEFASRASTADYTLVIAPETGGRLEQLASEVVRVGGRLLGPSLEAIRLTSDKLVLARHWTEHGISTPETWLLNDEFHAGSVVVKPRDGAGSQRMALVAVSREAATRSLRSGARELAHSASIADSQPRPPLALRSEDSASRLHDVLRDDNHIVQPFIPGFAASVAFLIGPAATVPLIPCAQCLLTDGRFQYEGGYLPIAPDLGDRALRIAAAAVQCVPGLLGYVGVDVVIGDDGRDWAIEINPRLTTSYVGLRGLARFNIAEAMLAIVNGQPFNMSWANEPIQFTPTGQVTPLAASRAHTPTHV